LRAQDIHRIVDTFTSQTEIDRFSRLVPFDEIATKNDFNLNIPRYIDASAPEDIHDLSAHLQGGIPNADIDALKPFWDVLTGLRGTLFGDSPRDGYATTLVEPRDVKRTISEHPQFQAFKTASMSRFDGWKNRQKPILENIVQGDKPKELIRAISEDLLASFHGADLLDQYDVYQILMTYWEDVMQDDAYMLVQDGWAVASTVRQLVPYKDKNGANKYREDADFEFGTQKKKTKHRSDITRPEHVVERFFGSEKSELVKLEAFKDLATQKKETYIDDNSGEEGLVEIAKNGKGSFTQASVKLAIESTNDAAERAACSKLMQMIKTESASNAKVKKAKAALDLLTFEKIPTLTEAETKALAVCDKWLATIEARIGDEIERVTQTLTNRVKELEERYAKPLPALEEAVSDYSAKVEAHLRKMGLSW
jgi:type I restriction enzyme M protein